MFLVGCIRWVFIEWVSGRKGASQREVFRIPSGAFCSEEGLALIGQNPVKDHEEGKGHNDRSGKGCNKTNASDEKTKDQKHGDGRQHIPKGIDGEFRHSAVWNPFSAHPYQSDGGDKGERGKQGSPAVSEARTFRYGDDQR